MATEETTTTDPPGIRHVNIGRTTTSVKRQQQRRQKRRLLYVILSLFGMAFMIVVVRINLVYLLQHTVDQQTLHNAAGDATMNDRNESDGNGVPKSNNNKPPVVIFNSISTAKNHFANVNDATAFAPRTTSAVTNQSSHFSSKNNRHTFLFNSTATGIDVVYSWVNGSDPIHKEQLAKYKAGALYSEAIEVNRFRAEWNELYYSLRLLYKHASGMRNVYIVTGGERPQYADEFPQVQWVEHSEFIPSKFLPIFSSCAIEFGLIHLLEHLSDPFIYSNDDFFILKPLDLIEHTSKKTWYQDAYGKDWTDNSEEGATYSRAIVASMKALQRVFPEQYRPANCLGHVPITIRHATLRRIHQDMPNEVNTSMAQFRNPGCMVLNYMLSQVERYTMQEAVTFLPSYYVTNFIPMGDNTIQLRRDFLRVKKFPKQFFCLNDNVEHPSPQHATIINEFFQNFL